MQRNEEVTVLIALFCSMSHETAFEAELQEFLSVDCALPFLNSNPYYNVSLESELLPSCYQLGYT